MTPPDTAAGMMFAVPGVLLILYGFWAQKRIAEGRPTLGQMMGPTTIPSFSMTPAGQPQGSRVVLTTGDALGRMIEASAARAAGTSAATAAKPAAQTDPPLFVMLCDSLLEAQMAVKYMKATESGGAHLKLSLIPMQSKTGGLDWDGQDSSEKWHNVTRLKEPAWIFIARETLPLLKQSHLWPRVRRVEEGK
jgi:hypothetical protein